MINFLIGLGIFILGGVFGMFLMACLVVGGNGEWKQ